jgi:hypothetical protein
MTVESTSKQKASALRIDCWTRGEGGVLLTEELLRAKVDEAPETPEANEGTEEFLYKPSPII